MTLVLLAALGSVFVGFVLYPVFSREARVEDSPSDAAEELKQLEEAKQRLLATIKDLEFEYKAGKLSEDDYQRVRESDLAQVAQIMARMDEMAGKKKEESKPASATPESDAKAPSTSEGSGTVCGSCQQVNPAEARFCLRCGKPISQKLECAKCGVELPGEAQFCIRCGTAVQT